jgi:hypothetical protein
MMPVRYKALLVGVHELSADPDNLRPLHGPPHDVPALRAALSNRGAGLIAADDIVSVMNPTKAQAEHVIHGFFSAGQRDDVLLFYFSGHGRLTRENKLFLCATDTATLRLPITGIAATTLRDCMEASDAQTLVVILDCCHSGAFRGGLVPGDVLGGRGTFFLASARAQQLADDGDGHGPSPFTAAIVHALQDAATDLDGDGVITFDDVYRVAYARLAPMKQFPQRSTGEGMIALARSPAGPRPLAVTPAEPVAIAGPRAWPRATPGSFYAGAAGGGAPVAPSAPGASGSVLHLVHEMQVRLLAGYAGDAIVQAAAAARVALAVITGRISDPSLSLADLLEDLRRTGKTELVVDARWLDQRRAAAATVTGQVHEELDDDARRASEIALRLARDAGLITEAEVTACQRSAAWQASRPASSALLRLDRASHRKALDDLLESPRRVLVLLVHGEVGQGHDHFGEVMTWRLRSGRNGRWREVVVNWPPPSRSLGSRLAMLFEELAGALGVALTLSADDPTTPGGARAWRTALAPVFAAIDAHRGRLLVRHVLRWLGTGGGGDDALVDAYVRAIWAEVAARAGERVVVGLDLRRIEHGGMPLSRAWRTSRAELAAVRAITAVLDRLDMPHGGTCIALPELTSVAISDLVDWLRVDGGRKRDAAETEADALVSSTRGGRFDLIVERLTALHLDRQRASK